MSFLFKNQKAMCNIPTNFFLCQLILSGNYSVRKIHTDISTLPEYMVIHQKAIGIPIM